MRALLTRARLARLAGYASTQVAVQGLGFACGLVLIRAMDPTQYGFYTLAISLMGVANVLADLGLSTAVLAIGGRWVGRVASMPPTSPLSSPSSSPPSTQSAAMTEMAATTEMAALMADAEAQRRVLAGAALVVVLPAFVWLLMHQQAPAWEACVLAALGGACAVLYVRNAVAIALVRLEGRLGLQQRLDLASNAAKLVLLWLLAATATLDATLACGLNLAVALVAFAVLQRHLRARIGAPAAATGEHRPALRAFVARQAPNSVYYVLSSQFAVLLIGLFGTAQRVAQVGALGRLGAAFAIVAAIVAAIVQPYFARQHGVSELGAGFGALNAVFAALTVGLVSAALLFPGQILWVLGGHYGTLANELGWMMLAASLSAWSAALYGVGCARGWVLPTPLAMGSGALAIVIAAQCFDLSTVVGSFQLNALVAFVATGVSFVYVALQLQRLRRADRVVT